MEIFLRIIILVPFIITFIINLKNKNKIGIIVNILLIICEIGLLISNLNVENKTGTLVYESYSKGWYKIETKSERIIKNTSLFVFTIIIGLLVYFGFKFKNKKMLLICIVNLLIATFLSEKIEYIFRLMKLVILFDIVLTIIFDKNKRGILLLGVCFLIIMNFEIPSFFNNRAIVPEENVSNELKKCYPPTEIVGFLGVKDGEGYYGKGWFYNYYDKYITKIIFNSCCLNTVLINLFVYAVFEDKRKINDNIEIKENN